MFISVSVSEKYVFPHKTAIYLVKTTVTSKQYCSIPFVHTWETYIHDGYTKTGVSVLAWVFYTYLTDPEIFKSRMCVSEKSESFITQNLQSLMYITQSHVSIFPNSTLRWHILELYCQIPIVYIFLNASLVILSWSLKNSLSSFLLPPNQQ